MKNSQEPSRVRWLWNIIKNGLFLHGIVNKLDRFGLGIRPYYWEQEGAETSELPIIRDTNPEKYQVSVFKEEDISLICNSSVRGIDGERLYKDFKRGNLCIGVKHNKEIAAFMFIELNDFVESHKKFSIKENEAYLYYMYTSETYRGKNLAPYLRYKSYELLSDMGREFKYSITDYFNKSSLKFKNKLNAKHLKLYLHLHLFKKYNKHLLLKSYS